MSIRIITKNGAVIGYQAIAGAGGAGLSAYIKASAPDALAVAAAKSADLVAKHRADRQQVVRDELRGLRMSLHRSRREGSPPVVYVDAQWRHNGIAVHRSYSTDSNGLLDAVVMAMCELERGTGRTISLPPRRVLAELFVRFDRAENRAPINIAKRWQRHDGPSRTFDLATHWRNP